MEVLEHKAPEVGLDFELISSAEAEVMQAHFDMPSAVRSETEIGNLPPTIDIAALSGDTELVRQAERNLKSRFVGSVAVSETVSTMEKPIKDLREGIEWASKGDTEGHAMVRENVATDAMERIFKAGNIKETRLQVDGSGSIYQYGQRMEDVYRNAYQIASNHHIIKPRTIAEANNGARMKWAYEQGYLEDYVMLVFSMCPEGVDDKDLDKLHFFSPTKSMSVQAVTQVGGELVMESAFVAGVSADGGERHDRGAIERVGDRLGVDYRGETVPGILNRPVLIHKDVMRNGVVDVVEMLDQETEAMTGQPVFFGQAKEKQDYVDFKKFCADREAGFSQNIDDITEELIAEKDNLIGAVEASKRLGKLVEAKMVNRATTDKTIDERVFGSTSAGYIREARRLVDLGMHEQAQHQLIAAVLTAESGSCPSALNNSSLAGIVNLLAVNLDPLKAQSLIDSDHDEKGSLKFSCPHCKHVNTRPRGGLIDNCGGCKESVRC